MTGEELALLMVAGCVALVAFGIYLSDLQERKKQ